MARTNPPTIALILFISITLKEIRGNLEKNIKKREEKPNRG